MPPADTEDIKQIIKLFTAGRYAEAEQLCDGLAVLPSASSRFFYLYGLSCYKNGHSEKAAAQFRRAVVINPEEFDALYNLGVISGETGQYDESIAAYQALLEKTPYLKAFANLGQALMKAGKHDDGAAVFNRGLALDPKDMPTASLFMEFECLYLPMRERAGICNRVLAMPGLPDTIRHTALLYRATAEWAAQDMSALEASLSDAARIKPQPGNQDFINMSIYKTFLTRLLAYRKENSALYEGAGQPLCMIGDSHSLTYAGLPVNRAGVDYKIESHLLIGAKAWHCGAPKPDARRAALAHYMERLPEGAELVCAFGEIDCRTNTGILPYWKKTGGELERIVSTSVEKYAAFVMATAARRSLQLIFLSIPAPHPASGDRRQVIALFNRELARRVQESGHRYIDLHALTLDEGGQTDEKLFIDNYHLKPEMLRVAFNRLLHCKI